MNGGMRPKRCAVRTYGVCAVIDRPVHPAKALRDSGRCLTHHPVPATALGAIQVAVGVTDQLGRFLGIAIDATGDTNTDGNAGGLDNVSAAYRR